jgi:outer membrane protein
MKLFSLSTRAAVAAAATSFAVVLGTALPAAPAHAQELKIGYVNSERILRESAAARAAQTKLEAEFGRRERELTELANRVKTTGDRLERDAPTLSEAERNRRQRELVELDRDLQRKRREFQEDLNQRRNEELSAVVERANRVIKQIFDAERYDVILQEVVFAGPRVDITDKVIRALDAPAPAGR